ncbi:MAG: hypothetical protein B6I20_07045 [Bacteroidetes bacterium 4572_117]|nr:MAG: hypothetical protein B6I20_07045 [Bacteroidetes bacterium 4572_117]
MTKGKDKKNRHMKNTAIITVMIFGFLSAITSCEQNNIDIDTTTPVVEAYLIPGKPVEQVKLTKLIPYLSDNGNYVAEGISDAEITITNNNENYKLLPVPDKSGENQTYNIDFEYNNKTISASTITPQKPTNFTMSQNIIYIDRLVEGERPNMENAIYEITWDNDDGSNYYISIDLLETEIDPVSFMVTDTVTQTLSTPSVTDVYNINSRLLRYYGNHRVVLYKVNEEYANLYENTSTSSQSLTDPYTNIENGKGIFTAFNTDTLFFEVKEY